MPPDDKRHYEVGYGKPPRRTRFTKGQSGNPRGRVRGGKNLKTLLDETLNEPVIVAENGGPTMLARIGVMRALNRHVERVFNPDRKDHHWGKRKLARDR